MPPQLRRRADGSAAATTLVATVALTLGLCAAAASAEPLATIQSNGPSANRLDIVVLGDGYTAAEMSKYAADVQAFLTQFFAESPFSEYRSYFNVHRVDVESAESGADKAPEGIFRNTALGAFYYCANTERLICVDNTAVNGVLSRSVNVNQRDLVVILVNDTKYGGSGGQWAVLSLHVSSGEIAEHEIGHTLGLLADEYVDTALSCNTTIEPVAVNVTIQTVREFIKWAAWIAPATPIPTFGSQQGVPGLYEGGQYCPSGKYRPTFNSKMRSLGQPFEQINSEQLTKRFYNFVSPIDSWLPSEASVTVGQGASTAFSVLTPAPTFHALEVRWKVDGQEVGTSAQLLLDTSTLGVGAHVVEVTVSDPTGFVRSDPTGVLRDSHAWTLNITAACSVAVSAASTTLPRAGGTGTIAVTVSPAACAWTASSDASWLMPSLAGGTGTHTLSFTAVPNATTAGRLGHLTIGGQSLSISQLGPDASDTPAVLPPSPAAGTGTVQTFTFTFYDANGATNLDVVNVLINFFLDGRFGCYLAYARSINVLYLVNDAGDGLLPGLVLDGSPQSLGNGQCLIDGAGSSAATSGNVLTLTLKIAFEPLFAGTKVIYQAGRDLDGHNSGWVQQGVWHVPGPAPVSPAVVSMTPARGGGVGYPFQFVYRDYDGFGDLVSTTVLLNSYLDGGGACYLGYHVPSNTVILLNDPGNAYLPALVLGGTGSVENSQCRILAQGSGAIGDGTDLTLTLVIEFKPAFKGERIFYLSAQDAASTSGWQSLGSWTVP